MFVGSDVHKKYTEVAVFEYERVVAGQDKMENNEVKLLSCNADLSLTSARISVE